MREPDLHLKSSTIVVLVVREMIMHLLTCDMSRTSGNDIKAYASAASGVSSASAPSALAGGQLLDDSQLASVTASASGSSSSATGR